jgi:DNA polymerase-3 subunit epsilon
MREIVLDTETTGFDHLGGDRVVEIGCVELVNHIPTARHFHVYLNPERPMPQAAFQIHGLSDQFLADKPKFAEVADKLLEFIGDAPLVAHNAEFDIKFLSAELKRIGKSEIDLGRATDTVQVARRKFPGSPASLDALCKRFGIDNSNRTLHGALLDAQLLAEVYLELLGGRQAGLGLVVESEVEIAVGNLDFTDGRRGVANGVALPVRPPRPHMATPDELVAHQSFIAKLKDAIWLKP